MNVTEEDIKNAYIVLINHTLKYLDAEQLDKVLILSRNTAAANIERDRKTRDKEFIDKYIPQPSEKTTNNE